MGKEKKEIKNNFNSKPVSKEKKSSPVKNNLFKVGLVSSSFFVKRNIDF